MHTPPNTTRHAQDLESRLVVVLCVFTYLNTCKNGGLTYGLMILVKVRNIVGLNRFNAQLERERERERNINLSLTHETSERVWERFPSTVYLD